MQTDRQREIEIETENRQRQRTDRQRTDRQRQIERQTQRQRTDRQRPTDRQADRQTDRHTDAKGYADRDSWQRMVTIDTESTMDGEKNGADIKQMQCCFLITNC